MLFSVVELLPVNPSCTPEVYLATPDTSHIFSLFKNNALWHREPVTLIPYSINIYVPDPRTIQVDFSLNYLKKKLCCSIIRIFRHHESSVDVGENIFHINAGIVSRFIFENAETFFHTQNCLQKLWISNISPWKLTRQWW